MKWGNAALCQEIKDKKELSLILMDGYEETIGT